jgi:uncharacterized protein (DUF488 family)
MDGVSHIVTVFTIGHSTRTLEEFIELLRESGIELLVDVRAIPWSRRMPQFSTDALAASLEQHGIDYEHAPALGGRRRKQKDAPLSPNTYWRIEAFRHYADYAATPEFGAAIDALIAKARERRCTIMCAEAVWWRCHRRIVTDYLIARGVAVTHIMGPGKIEPATITPGAQILPDQTILYVKEPQLFVE